MRAVLLLNGLFAIALAATAQVKLIKQEQTLNQNTKELLQLQRAILRLFQNINQPNYFRDQVKTAEYYDIENNIDNYNVPEAVREFMDLNRLGFLPKDEIFSIFNEQHRREAISLFKILYYVKDYITLYRTACWARVFMNEGLFVYSLSVALVQRPDAAMIDLPPIYEIYPEYFYNADVIQSARKARQSYKDLPRPTFDEQMRQMQTEQNQWPRPPWQYPWQETLNRPMETSFEEQQELRPNEVNQERTVPLWYNLLPESLRPQQNWFEQWRQEPLTPEQFRLDQLRQEQLRQYQINQEKVRLESPEQDAFTQRQEMKDQNKFTGITIDANYSLHSMSYFMEDIGLNAYYYYYNIYYPFWLPNEMINLGTEKRGEQFYFMIQQLLARYYLERLSNGQGNIPILDFSIPIRTGYYPSMTYPNGLRFPERPSNLWISMQRAVQNVDINDNYTNSYMFVRDYERRIRDAIDLGYVTTSAGKQISLYDARGLEILGNMIEGNPESPNARFYGCLQIFARLLLGNSQLSNDTYHIAPSALEQFETSLRDPVFYEFYKRMLMYFQRYLINLPPYSVKELLMPGVKIEDVEVDRLITYFDYFYTDISNAVYNKQSEASFEDVPVRAKQRRLNNKPFNYVLNVLSDRFYNALVKVFLGPKNDEMGQRLDIAQNRLNFVELDKFIAVLNPGINRIQRNSRDNFYSRDRTSCREMYMRVMMDMDRPSLPEYEPREPEWGMPRRLLLPKGTKNGQTYQMYFIITPYKPIKDKSSKKNLEMAQTSWRRVVDNYALGFPLDRSIDESVFYVPNSLFKDVIIYNEDMENMS